MAQPSILINLLPAELTVSKISQQKFRKIQAISIIAILLFSFLASAVVGLRIFQAQAISGVESQARSQLSVVDSLKEKEVDINILKNRTALLTNILKSSSKTATTYAEINSLVPSSVAVTSFSLDKNGNVLISFVASSSSSAAELLNKIGNFDSKNIEKVQIETLSRGRDGVFRGQLKILAKT